MTEKPTYEELEQRIQELERVESNLKRSKEELIHSYDLMDYIISHARSAIAVFDRDLRYIYVSRRYLKDYNVKEKNVIGKHHYEVFPDIPDKWKDVHKRSLAGEVLSEEEDSYYREDSSVHWTRWECRPWYKSNGSIGGIIIYNEIINERKQAEEEKEKLEEIFHKEKETLSMILERTPHGISLVDNDGKYLYLNPYYTKITGYTLEDTPSKEEWFKKAYPDENYRKEIIEAWNNDILEGELGKIREFKIKCKNGDTKHIEFRSAFLKDKKISVLTDVTSRKESEKIVREKDRLQGVLELSGAVCHEMNQPLMGAFGYSDLILMDMSEDDINRSKMEKLQIQLKRISNITKEMMKISRYQTKDYLNEKILDLAGTSKHEISSQKDINQISDTSMLASNDTDKSGY